MENNEKVWTTYRGDVTLEVIKQALQSRIENVERFKQARFWILDYSNANLSLLKEEEIISSIKMIEVPAKTNPYITVIGIMPHALEYGISRMWQAYSGETPWKSVIVKSLRECEEYLSTVKS